MVYERRDYRTSDGSMDIDFFILYCNEEIGWRIYIISDINYKGRNESGHATHRSHYDDDTYQCVCWLGKLSTLEEAKAVAALWGDCTAGYIKGGGSFDAIAKRLMKRR